MRELWKPSQVRIGSRQAIQLKTVCMGHENLEHCLASKNGDIWEYGRGTYRAIVKRDSKGRKLSEEQRKRFGAAELETWIQRLAIPEDPKDQTPRANGFNE